MKNSKSRAEKFASSYSYLTLVTISIFVSHILIAISLFIISTEYLSVFIKKNNIDPVYTGFVLVLFMSRATNSILKHTPSLKDGLYELYEKKKARFAQDVLRSMFIGFYFSIFHIFMSYIGNADSTSLYTIGSSLLSFLAFMIMGTLLSAMKFELEDIFSAFINRPLEDKLLSDLSVSCVTSIFPNWEKKQTFLKEGCISMRLEYCGIFSGKDVYSFSFIDSSLKFNLDKSLRFYFLVDCKGKYHIVNLTDYGAFKSVERVTQVMVKVLNGFFDFHSSTFLEIARRVKNSEFKFSNLDDETEEMSKSCVYLVDKNLE